MVCSFAAVAIALYLIQSEAVSSQTWWSQVLRGQPWIHLCTTYLSLLMF